MDRQSFIHRETPVDAPELDAALRAVSARYFDNRVRVVADPRQRYWGLYRDDSVGPLVQIRLRRDGVVVFIQPLSAPVVWYHAVLHHGAGRELNGMLATEGIEGLWEPNPEGVETPERWVSMLVPTDEYDKEGRDAAGRPMPNALRECLNAYLNYDYCSRRRDT